MEARDGARYPQAGQSCDVEEEEIEQHRDPNDLRRDAIDHDPPPQPYLLLQRQEARTFQQPRH